MAVFSPPARPFRSRFRAIYATSVLPRHRRDKSGPFGSMNAPFCCQPRRQTAKPNSHTPATSTARLFAADKVLYCRQRREPNRALDSFCWPEALNQIRISDLALLTYLGNPFLSSDLGYSACMGFFSAVMWSTSSLQRDMWLIAGLYSLTGPPRAFRGSGNSEIHFQQHLFPFVIFILDDA